jgi:hypothetical protein
MSYEVLHCMPQLSTAHGMPAFANKHDIQKKKKHGMVVPGYVRASNHRAMHRILHIPQVVHRDS